MYRKAGNLADCLWGHGDRAAAVLWDHGHRFLATRMAGVPGFTAPLMVPPNPPIFDGPDTPDAVDRPAILVHRAGETDLISHVFAVA